MNFVPPDSHAPSAARRPFDADAAPITQASLARDLERLGVAAGATLLVHASLSSVGWVFGGTQAVIGALLDVLGPAGTLMMPTHSSDLTEPSRWQRPPVPQAWFDPIRDGMAPWDPARTPTRRMGALAEHFRCWPGVRRSGHPYGSFAALGPNSDVLLDDHRPGCAFGEASPVGALNRLDGLVLLLGVGHGNDTSLHLAEYRADWPSKARHEEGSPMVVDGERRWVTYTELRHDDEDFPELGDAFDAQAGKALATGRVGEAEARLIRQRPLVDFATAWMSEHRR
jgi:aminoglycoside 3-N-acetyltransferase